MFTNEIFPVSSRKCAKIKIALSVQIEKCAKYLQRQYIPIYSIPIMKVMTLTHCYNEGNDLDILF